MKRQLQLSLAGTKAQKRRVIKFCYGMSTSCILDQLLVGASMINPPQQAGIILSVHCSAWDVVVKY